jgi:hypothetical protein
MALSGRTFLASDKPSLRSDGRPGQTRREAGTQSQGSHPRPPGCRPESEYLLVEGSYLVKANLARFTWAVTLLAIMALSLGAGMRWEC